MRYELTFGELAPRLFILDECFDFSIGTRQRRRQLLERYSQACNYRLAHAISGVLGHYSLLQLAMSRITLA
jgi:hypothetical protein